MKLKIKTFSGYMYSQEYSGTYEEAKKKLRDRLRKAGWTEVADLTGIHQYKIMGVK